MGFIELFFQGKKEIASEDLTRFISQKTEENARLDYKDIKAYDDPDSLAVNISSFANLEGGVIVLGVSEDEIKDEEGRTVRIHPKEVTWGRVSLEKERLENMLMARIAPPIAGLIIKPIRNEKNEVIFLIDVPKSSSAPHMSSDHKYHVRMNFRKREMEHYEVANLLKANWLMKEKLVEKIFEPLSAVLEKHANEIGEYSCPSIQEVEEIMSRTYYKTQVPQGLLDKIGFYMDQIRKLSQKEHFARKATHEIAGRNILEHLRKEHSLSSDVPVSLDSTQVLTKLMSRVDLGFYYLSKLLLKGISIQDYLKKEYWTDVYESISILHLTQRYDMNLGEFDEIVWAKCLEEASTDTRIAEMRESAHTMKQEAWNLIEEITKH